MDLDVERALRGLIMARLEESIEDSGGFVSRASLSAFPMGDGTTRRLVDTSKGIWNPRDLAATLAVVSAPDGPYEDGEVVGGLFRYAYRAGSDEGDNTKLRRALEFGLPIILLRKVDAGVFMPVFPTYVVSDDRAERQFLLALDEELRRTADPLHLTDVERRYAERVVHSRLHQAEFRVRVMRAYGVRCAVCHLGHAPLLDASHIVEDGQPLGQPVVPNGLSLCKIHHAAYDRDLLGISPDLRVSINAELLAEADGPMLQHGLKEMHGRILEVPRRRADRPDPERLDLRFQRFRAAS